MYSAVCMVLFHPHLFLDIDFDIYFIFIKTILIFKGNSGWAGFQRVYPGIGRHIAKAILRSVWKLALGESKLRFSKFFILTSFNGGFNLFFLRALEFI